MLYIYTDGSSRGNNKGGYGIVIFNELNQIINIYNKQFDNVTNNQMELLAILKSFELIKEKYSGEKIKLYSDSSYCINILTDWIYKWSNNNWKNSKNKDIKNLDIIKSLYEYYNIKNFIRQIKFVKIKGHVGNVGNEIADALAKSDTQALINIILKNNIKIKIDK